MTITVREATERDAQLISDLNRDVQAKHVMALPWLFKDVELAPERITAFQRDSNSIWLLACAGDEAVGYIYAQVRCIPDTPLTFAYETVHVHHIAVRESVQQSGIGRALVDAVKTTARRPGIGRVTADVWSFNSEAIDFFEKCG